MRPRTGLALAAVAVVFSTAPARAEVAVRLNEMGQVTHLDIDALPAEGIIWQKLSDKPDVQILNPNGDAVGDRYPTYGIVAMPSDPLMNTKAEKVVKAAAGPTTSGYASPNHKVRRVPIVVWSRFDGHDFELVFSSWDYDAQTWRGAAFVERLDNEVDDLDPRLYVRGKRIYLVWHRSSADTPVLVSNATIQDTGSGYDFVWNTPIVVPGILEAGSDLSGIERALIKHFESDLEGSGLKTPEEAEGESDSTAASSTTP